MAVVTDVAFWEETAAGSLFFFSSAVAETTLLEVVVDVMVEPVLHEVVMVDVNASSSFFCFFPAVAEVVEVFKHGGAFKRRFL